MAIKSSFFNSVNGDRRYLANNFAEYFASFIANGVFPNPSNSLQVYEKANMQVVVKPGKGWINGYFAINEYDYELTLENADGLLNRIDRVVLRLDLTSRAIEIVVKKGAFASSPTSKTLQRDADAYELALADVYISKGATTIKQLNITDQRLNTSLCGVVSGVVKQVDTTTVFNQYISWFTSLKSISSEQITVWQNQVKLEFDEWFDSVKDILKGDIATNLTSRILTLEQDLLLHKNDNTKHFYFAECGNLDSEPTKIMSIDDFTLKNGTRITVFFILGKAGTVASLKINDLDPINLGEVTKVNDMFVTFIYQSGNFYLLNKQQHLVGDLSALKTSDKTTIVNAINETLSGTTWQTPIFLNGYVDGGLSRYKRVGNTLHLQVNARGTAIGTDNPIFNLPSAYRPTKNLFPTFTQTGLSATIRGYVGTEGNVAVSAAASELSTASLGFIIHLVIPL